MNILQPILLVLLLIHAQLSGAASPAAESLSIAKELPGPIIAEAPSEKDEKKSADDDKESLDQVAEGLERLTTEDKNANLDRIYSDITNQVLAQVNACSSEEEARKFSKKMGMLPFSQDSIDKNPNDITILRHTLKQIKLHHDSDSLLHQIMDIPPSRSYSPSAAARALLNVMGASGIVDIRRDDSIYGPHYSVCPNNLSSLAKPKGMALLYDSVLTLLKHTNIRGQRPAHEQKTAQNNLHQTLRAGFFPCGFWANLNYQTPYQKAFDVENFALMYLFGVPIERIKPIQKDLKIAKQCTEKCIPTCTSTNCQHARSRIFSSHAKSILECTPAAFAPIHLHFCIYITGKIFMVNINHHNKEDKTIESYGQLIKLKKVFQTYDDRVCKSFRLAWHNKAVSYPKTETTAADIVDILDVIATLVGFGASLNIIEK